jgi:hypothetical protein
MEIPDANSSIAQAHFACIDAFQNLLEDASASDQGPPKLDSQGMRDAFDRYKLWAGNMGAMHFGQQWEMSLDYRLREASFYKVQVVNEALLHWLKSSCVFILGPAAASRPEY